MAHSTEELLFQLFAIFVTAKLAGEIFERLRLPAVLGEMLAGVALGPYAFGLIRPVDTIHSLSEIGAIFVLFLAGMQTSPQDLIRVGRKALVVATVGVIVPFVLGFLYVYLRAQGAIEATFVGAAMVATSVAITARVLGDLGVLATPSARIILGAAVFDDILGMVLLAVVTGLASRGRIEWVHLGILAAEAIIFTVFMLFFGSRMIRPLRHGVQRLSTNDAGLLLSLAICMLLSWLAAKIGMAGIIGAFFAGLIFADYAPEWNLLPRVQAITDFLGPFFFFFIGSQLDIRLFQVGILVPAMVVSVLAVASKVIGCGLPMIGEGLHPSLRVGVGMMPRGEVALIVALVGLNSGIISQSTYALVVFMTVVTTILAPPLLRYLFRMEGRAAPPAAGPLP
ncbi:MAG TPA: cation:proton antiporter [Terriglobales bacterium]|jgi:Kef-type K+ transport system membrane component KefB